MLLAVVVTASSVLERHGSLSLLASLQHRFSRMRRSWADQAYMGDRIAWLWGLRPWRNICLEVVKRPESITGFLLLPKRGIVERTFAWLGRYRRLVTDYEHLIQTAEAMIRVAMIHLMVRIGLLLHTGRYARAILKLPGEGNKGFLIGEYGSMGSSAT